MDGAALEPDSRDGMDVAALEPDSRQQEPEEGLRNVRLTWQPSRCGRAVRR